MSNSIPRNFAAKYHQVAASANTRESALNTFQTLDTGLLVDINDVFNLTPRTQNNIDELTGKEEADTQYDLGYLLEGTFNFPVAQAQHFAFLLAYALGGISTSGVGVGGYAHTLTPTSAMTNPGFTLGQKLSEIRKIRFASNFMDSVEINLEKDNFAKISGNVKGTGKYETNYLDEEVTAAGDATSLTVANNVLDDNIKNIHRILATVSTGQQVDVTYTEVEDKTITIAAPEGDNEDDITYRVFYVADEESWCSFPSRVTESPLKVSQLSINVGGKWTGSAISGGFSLSNEINSFAYTLNNNFDVEFRPVEAGESDSCANMALRQGRIQKIVLDRQYRDIVFEAMNFAGNYFVVYAKLEGAEFETGHKYTVELILPRVGIINPQVSVNNNRFQENIEMDVLQDDTYGSIIAKVKNMVATYAAVPA